MKDYWHTFIPDVNFESIDLYTTICETLIDEGKLGRKSKSGLYQRIVYDNGLSRQTVYDINSEIYRDVLPYTFPFAEEMKSFESIGSSSELVSLSTLFDDIDESLNAK